MRSLGRGQFGRGRAGVLGLISLQLAAHLQHRPLQRAHPFQALGGGALMGRHQFGHRVELLVHRRQVSPVAGGRPGRRTRPRSASSTRSLLEAADGAGRASSRRRRWSSPCRRSSAIPSRARSLTSIASAAPGGGGATGGAVGARVVIHPVEPALEAVDAVGQAGQGPGAVLDAAGQPGQRRIGERVGRSVSGWATTGSVTGQWKTVGRPAPAAARPKAPPPAKGGGPVPAALRQDGGLAGATPTTAGRAAPGAGAAGRGASGPKGAAGWRRSSSVGERAPEPRPARPRPARTSPTVGMAGALAVGARTSDWPQWRSTTSVMGQASLGGRR